MQLVLQAHARSKPQSTISWTALGASPFREDDWRLTRLQHRYGTGDVCEALVDL
jgi:hypothetical protein